MFLVFRTTFIVIVVCYFNLIIKKKTRVLDNFFFLLFKAYNSNREEKVWEARQIIDDECKQKRKREGERERGKEKQSFFTEYENEHTIVRI